VLFLEEVFEGLAGVVVARRSRRQTSAGGGRFLRVGRWRGVFFNGGAEFVEFAVVADVLGSDAFGDGLRALELRGRVEEAALLAAVEFETALGTLSVGVEAGIEDGTAVGAASAGDSADHARGARAELIRIAWPAGWRPAIVMLTAVGFVFLFVALGIAIAAMAVFAIH
jgi:hypothetical protein